jgi:hypothetical protein
VPIVIEVLKFRLVADVATEDFLERNADFQQRFVYQQDGLVRRTVASGLDGEWMVITWWRSMTDARRATTQALSSSSAMDFASMLEPNSVVTEYFKALPG